MSVVTMRRSAAEPTSTPRPGSGRLPRSRSSWVVLLVLDVAVPDYDISPGILLPLLGAILALLGLEASAFWKGVR
jgi:hypothetical protein